LVTTTSPDTCPFAAYPDGYGEDLTDVNDHAGHAVSTELTHPGTDAAPLRRDAVENRERILDVAGRLFAEAGIEAISMHRIAQAAGVGQATLYRHYTNKGDLCRDLMGESVERAKEDFEIYWRDSEGWRALDRLDGVIARVVVLFEEKLHYLAAIDEACSGEDRTTKFRLPVYRWIHGIIAGLLNEAQAEGDIPAGDADFTADAVLATLSPDVYQYQREERGLSQQQIVQGVRRLYT
jgi:AcrR family transcriptional regulator